MGDVTMPWDAPQVTRCGRIKIGCLGPERTSKGGTKWRPPVKLNRILITHDWRNEETGNFAIDEETMAALGAPTSDTAITEIPIEVHSDEIPDVLACKLVRYEGRKQLACSGDGTTAKERHGNEWRERECPCPRSTLVTEGGDCKPNAVFSCSLRVPGRRTIGAVYEFRTTSSISISRLSGSLATVKKAVGTLRGLPLTMALREVELSAGKANVYCMHIELREQSVEEAVNAALKQSKDRQSVIELSAGRSPAYLALPPGDEDPEEVATVTQEFYPSRGGEPAEAIEPDYCEACNRTNGHVQGCPEAPVREPGDDDPDEGGE